VGSPFVAGAPAPNTWILAIEIRVANNESALKIQSDCSGVLKRIGRFTGNLTSLIHSYRRIMRASRSFVALARVKVSSAKRDGVGQLALFNNHNNGID